MRVLISGGGTGGHVYPALAVVDQLALHANHLTAAAPAAGQLDSQVAAREPVGAQAAAAAVTAPAVEQAPSGHHLGVQYLWVGAGNGMERALVTHAGVDYAGIATGQLRGKNPLTVARNLGKMGAGFFESLALVRNFQPDVCLATGGYVCAPVVAACRLLGVPVMIYLPDMVPGWAIRALSRLAQRVAVSYPEVTPFFGGPYPTGKGVVTGYPVRRELVDAVGGGTLPMAAHLQKRAVARQRLADALDRPLCAGLGPDGESLPLLLVWGGSQGSLNINNATWSALPELLPHAQILHVVGNRDWGMWQERMTAPPVEPQRRQRYHPVAYLHGEMALALAAADLTVARAGASTLGEFPVARLPALLVPHPGVNQTQNADYLVQHGGAVMVKDALLQQQLTPQLLTLLQDVEKRRRMEAALAALAQPQAAFHIAEALHALVSTDRSP